MATYYVTTAGNNGNTGTSEGAAWADLGYAITQVSTGDTINVKSGTYTLTTSTAGAGGPVVVPSGLDVKIEGYETTPGDLGAKPVISAGAVTGINIFTATAPTFGDDVPVLNLRVDGNSQTGVRGFDLGVSARAIVRMIYCEAVNCPNSGFSGGFQIGCLADGNSVGFIGSQPHACVARNNTSHGFDLDSVEIPVSRLLAYGNGGDGIQSRGSIVSRCTMYGNTGSGFYSVLGNSVYALCLSVGNGTGFRNVQAGRDITLIRCAYYGNTTDMAGNVNEIEGITLTADPFTDAAGDDFTLNSAAGGGSLLKASGVILPGFSDSIDVGALQSSGSGGGGGGRPRIGNGGLIY